MCGREGGRRRRRRRRIECLSAVCRSLNEFSLARRPARAAAPLVASLARPSPSRDRTAAAAAAAREPCTFDLLVYTNTGAAVPLKWEESDARYIPGAEEVKLRSFSTKVHNVGTAVAYRPATLDEI